MLRHGERSFQVPRDRHQERFGIYGRLEEASCTKVVCLDTTESLGQVVMTEWGLLSLL